jgi:hypothetical protein
MPDSPPSIRRRYLDSYQYRDCENEQPLPWRFRYKSYAAFPRFQKSRRRKIKRYRQSRLTDADQTMADQRFAPVFYDYYFFSSGHFLFRIAMNRPIFFSRKDDR